MSYQGRAREPTSPASTFAGVDDPCELDGEPQSNVRPFLGGGWSHAIEIATGLGADAAAGACVTITDMSGTVLFEGPPGADGVLRVAFAGAVETGRVRITLETARAHRQAEVMLTGQRTCFAFS
jgi:hypothetical protein